MVSLSTAVGVIVVVLIAIIGWVGRGFFTNLGDKAATKLTSSVNTDRFNTAEPTHSDEEFDELTERFCTSLARRLHNRENTGARPVINPENPHESAIEQREFDIETIEIVYEDAETRTVMPSFETIRQGFRERGLWVTELDKLYEDAEDVNEFRELLIRLDELRNEL